MKKLSNLLRFPGAKIPDTLGEEEEKTNHVQKMLEAFLEKADAIDSAIIIGVKHNGQLAWGSSSGDTLEMLWLTKAMERIVMDHSMGQSESEPFGDGE